MLFATKGFNLTTPQLFLTTYLPQLTNNHSIGHQPQMDTPFDITEWQPTLPSEEPGEGEIAAELPTLILTLNTQTRTIYRHPYDPSTWLRRAETLSRMRYPELAVGDAYKAILLCRTLLARLSDTDGRWRLGYRMGFWMLDEVDDDREDNPAAESLDERLANLQADAHRVEVLNLYFFPGLEEGRFAARMYPWMEARHRVRSDELMARVNEEFAEAPPGCKGDGRLVAKGKGKKRRPSEEMPGNVVDDGGGPCCTLKRHAFGDFSSASGGKDSSDTLGVFAARDIAKGTVILVDETETWGCTGPGTDGNTANLYGGVGCSDPVHPNLPYEDTSQDLRWIRERAGTMAAAVLLRCRFLIRCIRDRVPHPLDHTLIARLTPTYRRDKVRLFSLEHDISIPNDCLQQHGIDIFANPAYDTWVLFTLEARIENNSWSDPIHTCISPLFSLFNHSCAPNAEWTVKADHTTLVIRVEEPGGVREGEQLLLMYDGFMFGQPVGKRRRRLRKWFDGECQCVKCAREEAEERARAGGVEGGWGCGCGGRVGHEGVAEWDVVDKPVFPEDDRVKVRR